MNSSEDMFKLFYKYGIRLGGVGGSLHFQIFSKRLDLSLDINDHEFSKALTCDLLPVQMQHIERGQENTSKGSL